MCHDTNAQLAGERASFSLARTILRPKWTKDRFAAWLLLFEHDRIHAGFPRLLQHNAFQPGVVPRSVEVTCAILDVGYQHDRAQ